MVRQLLEPLPQTPESPVSAVADREELVRLRAEADVRRKEDERKAAEARASEESRIAAERAEIARLRATEEVRLAAERAELRAQQEALKAEARRIEQAQHQGESESAVKKSPGRRPSDARPLLTSILSELEQFASDIGEPFDRQAMPGPLGESWDEEGSFHWLCAQIAPTFKRAKATFEKHRSGVCAVGQYAKRTDFYRNALPVIAPKLGGKSDVHSMQKSTKKAF